MARTFTKEEIAARRTELQAEQKEKFNTMAAGIYGAEAVKETLDHVREQGVAPVPGSTAAKFMEMHDRVYTDLQKQEGPQKPAGK